MTEKLFLWKIWADDEMNTPVFRYIDFDYPDASNEDVYNLCGFGKGISLPPRYGENMIFKLKKSGGGIQLPDFNEFPLWWILMSGRLQHIIETFCDPLDYQWIDPCFKSENREMSSKNFKLFNCKKHRDLVNWKLSSTHLYDNELRIDDLVIDRGKLGSMNAICRLAEDPAFLLVSGQIQKRCLEEGIVGMRSTEISVA